MHKLLSLLCLLFTFNVFAQNPYIGEIKIFGGNFAPRGFAFCNGQLLQISQYTALFSIIGTTYGGDGRTTFGLPDLRGRSPRGVGRGPGLPNTSWGEKKGLEYIIMTIATMPNHKHYVKTASASYVLAPNLLAKRSKKSSDPIALKLLTTPLSSNYSTEPLGGNQQINNRQPFLTVNYIIALSGVFPSRS